MESNSSAGNLISGAAAFGGIDLQGSMRLSHHQHPQNIQHHNLSRQGSIPHPSMQDVFPLTMGQMQDCDHQPNSVADFGKVDRGKNSPSEDDEPSFNEEGADGHNDSGKGKKVSVWQRVKWTDSMVKLLITAVSYIGDDATSECSTGGRRKYANLQKKGKWKSVSKVMAERGFCVSPQQCEDKFNDLNKRYKKLNDILGRGTSCQVVENPALLDMMDHLSDKLKDDVRKILSSKHLFYEEMCSYHNGNRLHLPADPALQRSLHLALRSRDDQETSDSRRHPSDDIDEDSHDAETDDHEDYEENRSRSSYGMMVDSIKRMKRGQGPDDFSFSNLLNPQQDFDKSFLAQQFNPQGDINASYTEGLKAEWMQMQWLKSRSVQLEEQKMQIELETLELEKQRLKWQKFSRKKDRELEKLKMENERMKLENERMALELKRMEMSLNSNQ